MSIIAEFICKSIHNAVCIFGCEKNKKFRHGNFWRYKITTYSIIRYIYIHACMHACMSTIYLPSRRLIERVEYHMSRYLPICLIFSTFITPFIHTRQCKTHITSFLLLQQSPSDNTSQYVDFTFQLYG